MRVVALFVVMVVEPESSADPVVVPPPTPAALAVLLPAPSPAPDAERIERVAIEQRRRFERAELATLRPARRHIVEVAS